MDDIRMPKISVGITSMVVILTVLCLTVFAVLTLSTALSERDFSEKRASAAKAYYAAEVECADIANSFGSLWEEGAGKAVIASFAQEKGAVLTEKNDEFWITYDRQIDEGQHLTVELRMGNSFEVLCWQVISNAEWNPDTTMNVWDGEITGFQ